MARNVALQNLALLTTTKCYDSNGEAAIDHCEHLVLPGPASAHSHSRRQPTIVTGHVSLRQGAG